MKLHIFFPHLRSRQSDVWTCRYCGQPLTIEAIEPGLDGCLKTHWHCDECFFAGITPAELRTPPAGVTIGHVCTLCPAEVEELPVLPAEQPQLFFAAGE